MQKDKGAQLVKLLDLTEEIRRLKTQRDELDARIDAVLAEVRSVAAGNLIQQNSLFDGDEPTSRVIETSLSGGRPLVWASKNMTLKERILELVGRSDDPWTSEEIHNALKTDNLQTVQSTVSRLAKAGLLIKPDKRHVARKDPFA